MAIKTFTSGEVLTASDTNTFLANSGLVYIKSQTVGNAVSSVQVTGAFSADYDNYKIVYNNGSSSNTTVIGLTFGSNTTANYYFSFIYATFGVNSALADTGNNTGRFTYAGQLHSTGASGANIEVMQPFLSKFTYISNPCYAGNGTYSGTQMGTLADTTSYTSFTLTANTGTMTGGTITVYGYRKA